MPDPETCVLIYEHRFGSDVSVYKDRKSAEISAACIALEWISDIEDPDIAQEIISHIEAERYVDAVSLYCQHTQEEMTLQSVTVYEGQGDLKEALIRAKKVIEESEDDGAAD